MIPKLENIDFSKDKTDLDISLNSETNFSKRNKPQTNQFKRTDKSADLQANKRRIAIFEIQLLQQINQDSIRIKIKDFLKEKMKND